MGTRFQGPPPSGRGTEVAKELVRRCMKMAGEESHFPRVPVVLSRLRAWKRVTWNGSLCFPVQENIKPTSSGVSVAGVHVGSWQKPAWAHSPKPHSARVLPPCLSPRKGTARLTSRLGTRGSEREPMVSGDPG